MFAAGSKLGSVKPSSASPVTIVAASALPTEVTLISVGVINGPVLVSVYHDDEGSTYNDNTLIMRFLLDVACSGSAGVVAVSPLFQSRHPGSGIPIKPGGTLGVAVDTANAANITAYGVTATVAQRPRG